ncbi:MAG: SDR family NAD(P)-dependent oxidoreductase [Cyanobacteriota bacterium]|jgi:NAD(P)-dependent dehydrogenase (short-subunit alcohol dehydrogenase family)
MRQAAPLPVSVSAADSPRPWSQWRGHALVVGTGGLGQALLAALPERAPQLRLWSAGRSQGELRLDLEDAASLEAFGQRVVRDLAPLRLVICAAGVLHGQGLQPEKRLSQVTAEALRRSFAVNAWGPLLLAQAVEAALPRQEPVHLASLSARVGSIADNRLGGWYAYRGAKAAQNQLLRTLALEWRRRLPLACVTLLHPGTTATALSAPFRAGVAASNLFAPERAAAHLLDVLEGQTPETSGAFLAWDGQPIPW